jgi:hypothetical protein
MSAREKLFQTMAGGWQLTQRETASLYQVIDSALDIHAHELAERIREDAQARHDRDFSDNRVFRLVGGQQAANLIDPSAGPVRPDEEPTT